MRAPLVRAHRWFHGRVLYPAIVRARGEARLYPLLREMEAVQWWSEERLLDRQAVKLSGLLDHAVRRSPFYARAWGRAGFEEAGIWEQFRELPIIGKSDLQESQEQMAVQPVPRRVTRKTTGGSTGQAVTVLKDRDATAAERAASWLGYGWFGIRPGDLGVRFWGNPVTLMRRLMYSAADVAMNRRRFSAFAFDDADLERYWRRCQSIRPDYFYGYVSMLEALAQYVVRSGQQRTWPELKAVITTAEVLTPPQRALMTEAFGAPVQNEYGCGEVGAIAYECEGGSLHLITENQVVEVLRPDGEPAQVGETGDVVVTDLNNRAMPLIRYRVGDLAVPGARCACGRGFPVLKRVWGREYDLVVTPDGRRYHGEFFMYLFEDLRADGIPIQQFQVVQVGERNLEVRLVVRDAERSDEIMKSVARAFDLRLAAMHATVLRVDEIAKKRSGKTAVVENHWRGASVVHSANVTGSAQ